MRVRLLLVAAFISALVGCGGGDDQKDGDSEPKADESTTTPSGPVSYGTVEELRDAAIEAGYDCPRWKQDDVVTLAAESGHCSGADVFATFASPDDLQAQIETDRGLDEMMRDAGLEPDPALVGPNWMITGRNAPDLADALGGTVNR